MKRKKWLIWLCGAVLAVVLGEWNSWPQATCRALPVDASSQAQQTQPTDATCSLTSYPASRPYAIEQHGQTLIVPSLTARQHTSSQSVGTAQSAERRALFALLRICRSVRESGISLPPESIAFPFSSFW